MSFSPEYKSYDSMKERCLNPKKDNYDSYGGAGITICDRWIESFIAFYNDMGARPEGHTLDRIDPAGNYEPSNCRWATYSEQSSNQKCRNKLGYKGVKKACKNRFEAHLRINGKLTYLGMHATVEDAARAYDNRSFSEFKDLSKLNFPEEYVDA